MAKKKPVVDARPKARIVGNNNRAETLKTTYAKAEALLSTYGTPDCPAEITDLMERIVDPEDPVQGVYVGRKYVGGELTGLSALCVVVRKKLKDADNPIPESIAGVAVDVLEGQFRPATGDVQAPDAIAPKSEPTNSGRLTALVIDNLSLGEMLLTCAHVVAGSKGVAALENRVSIVNPGGQVIGRSLRGADINWILDSDFDCALIEPVDPDVNNFLDGYRSNIFHAKKTRFLEPADVNQTILKRPNPQDVNQWIEGKVRAIKGTFQETSGKLVVDPILVQPLNGPFAAPGDSGQLVFSDSSCAVGMVRAVNLNASPNDPLFQAAILTPIKRVLSRMGLTIT